jgi:hypothetical protein
VSITLWCPVAEHAVGVKSSAPAGERFCPEHGCELVRPPKEHRKPSGRQGLPGEQGARTRFRQLVCARPCFFLQTDERGEQRRPGHTCRYPLDAHHVLSKGWLKRELDLPPSELVALMYDPIIGDPLCRKAHDAVEYSPDEYIYRDELNPDLILFCERFDAEHPEQRSLLARLYVECPERPEPVAANPKGDPDA